MSAETFDPTPEIIFTQASDPNKRSKIQFRKYYNYCHKPNHSVSNCFRKEREDGERNKGILILDQNHLPNPSMITLKHTRLKVIQMNKIHLFQ